MSCEATQSRIELYAWDEVSSSEQNELEAHLAACAGCRTELDQARQTKQLFSLRVQPEPSPELLVRCRQALSDSLDREQTGWRGLLAGWRRAPVRPVPAAVIGVLIVAGFLLGWALRERAPRAPAPETAVAREPGAPAPMGRIAGISQVSTGPDSTVRIGFDAERPVTLAGPVENPKIRRVLLDAMNSYGNAGIRLDTLEALRPAAGEPEVRQGMIDALRNDPNAGVRLQALRSIESAASNPAVEAALAAAVRGDANPGVRVAATDALVSHALAGRDEALLPVLRTIAAEGPDAYSRMKALAAVRDLQER